MSLLLTQIRDSIWNEDLWWARSWLLRPRLNCLTDGFPFFCISSKESVRKKKDVLLRESTLAKICSKDTFVQEQSWALTVDASMLFVSVATELKIIYIRHQRLLVLQISQLFSSSESNESGFGLKRSEDYPEDFLVILNHLANLIAAKAF